MDFISQLIDKNNTKCPKAFVGIVSSLSLVGTMIAYHTDTMVISVAGLAAAALGVSAWENNKTKDVPPTNTTE